MNRRELINKEIKTPSLFSNLLFFSSFFFSFLLLNNFKNVCKSEYSTCCENISQKHDQHAVQGKLATRVYVPTKQNHLLPLEQFGGLLEILYECMDRNGPTSINDIHIYPPLHRKGKSYNKWSLLHSHHNNYS